MPSVSDGSRESERVNRCLMNITTLCLIPLLIRWDAGQKFCDIERRSLRATPCVALPGSGASLPHPSHPPTAYWAFQPLSPSFSLFHLAMGAVGGDESPNYVDVK